MSSIENADIQISTNNGRKAPKEMLDELNQTLSESKMSKNENRNHSNNNTFKEDNISLPESARWALCGVKNLTRPPSHDSKVGERLIKHGVIPMLLNILTIDEGDSNNQFHQKCDNDNYNDADEDLKNDDFEKDSNIPYHWDGNSIQDTALYILMNLSLCESKKQILFDYNVGDVVYHIAKYSSSPTSPRSHCEEEKQKDLQCLKAVS